MQKSLKKLFCFRQFRFEWALDRLIDYRTNPSCGDASLTGYENQFTENLARELGLNRSVGIVLKTS